jgi:protein-disulfide isomerase
MSKNTLISLIILAIGALVVAVVVMPSQDEGEAPQTVMDEAAARQAALASEHSPSTGPANAKVHIVEFLDPACETCAIFFPMVKQWMAFHSGAEHAVKILEASRKQGKYWETLEAMLAAQSQWTQNHTVLPEKIGPAIASVGLDMDQLMVDMESIEVLTRMEQDKKDAITLKVSKTPDYFVNGRPLPSFGTQQLASLIREELGR